jgi:predicted transcriptional regulator
VENRRSSLEIMHEILDAARSGGRDGAPKTKIMYGAYLSSAQLKGYLKILTGNGLLNYDQVRQTFKITQKGLRFLKIYNEMEGTMVRKVEEQYHHHHQQ